MKSSYFRQAFPLFAFAAALSAQGLGTVTGTVTDPTGASVPSATVTIKQVGTGLERTTTTNEQGYFVLPSLSPTSYALSAAAPGFRAYSQTNITLQADQSLTINIRLEVGTAKDTLVVTGEPPQVNVSTATLSQVVDQERMVDMPLNGRNAANLTLLVAGTATTPAGGVDQGNTKTFPEGVTISTNGARQDQVSYSLDGGNNADIMTNINQPFPFPDSLQEFSVQTSNYSARYGMNAGGVVNVVTKSGTNQIHGDVFEFVRNAEFNARNYFAAVIDPLKRNQFGGTLGGPVRRDKTFFFVGYQGTRIRDTSSTQATVPTIANLNGDFSALLDATNPANTSPGKTIKIVDPLNGAAFPGNLIPVNRLDKAALAVEKLLPQVGGNGQTRYISPLAQDYDEFLLKVDHSLTPSDKLEARYFYDRYTQAAIYNPSNLLNYADSSAIVSQNALISETHVFGSELINQFNLGYSRVASARLPPSGVPEMTSLGINMSDEGLKAIQSIQVTSFFTVGSDPPALFKRNSYNLNDDFSWIHGRHTVHFGGTVQRDLYDVRNDTNIPGAFVFTSAITKYAPAAFLLGQINQLTQGSGQFVVNRNNFYGAYIQDDYHASRRLTMNIGLRYEPFFPWHSLLGVMEFSPPAYARGEKSTVYTNAPKGLLFPGDPGVPKWGYNGQLTDFAPRAGFAYDLTGDGKTSLRGGVGVFFDTHAGAINSQMWGSSTPYSTSLVLTQPSGPFSNPYAGISNPFPAPSPAPSNYAFPTPTAAYSYDPTTPYRVAVIYNWNLAVERQLAQSWLLRVAYVGSHGSHLQEYVEYNPAVYTPGSTLSTDQRRIFQPFGLVGMFEEDINSSYNALQTSLEKRLTHSFTILANYTYSKSIDDEPNGQNVTAMNVNLPNLSTLPWYMAGRHQMDRGPSIFDRTSRFVGSYVWSLPSLRGSSRFAEAVLGGWQWSGIVTLQTGDPLTVVAGSDISQTGLSADRGVQIGTQTYNGKACSGTVTCVNYLNPTAFTLPATGTFGDVGKGSLRGRGLFNWDVSLSKRIALSGERVQLQFRAEYFNIFNRANFNDPGVSLSGSGFGQILGAADPRIGQLSLKVLF